MALLKFTASDILKSKILEEAWYGLTCTKVVEPKASKDGDSVNYKVVFLVDNAEGKELEYVINSKGLGFHVSLIAAMMGKSKKELKPEAISVDMEEWVGKKVDGRIVQDAYNGIPNNKIADFLPYGMGTSGAGMTKGVF